METTIISLFVAFASLCYATYVHISHHYKRISHVKRRIEEEERFLKNMKILGITDFGENYLKFVSLGELIEKNNSMEKEIKKFNLT